MAVNKTPGQSASGFRLFIDKSKTNSANDEARLEEIVLGALFFYKGMQYKITKLGDVSAMMEGSTGRGTRSMLVSLDDLIKNGSEYKIVRI